MLNKFICTVLLITLLAMLCVGCKSNENTKVGNEAISSLSETDYVEKATDTYRIKDSIPSTATENVQNETVNIKGNTKMKDSFIPICQYPELPTGCEVTSLTMVLNYYGINADKCNISDNFLEKGDVGSVDFNVAFVGDPRDASSYGCYAPVIVNAANLYLEYNQSKLNAKNITGTELEDLFPYIDSEKPVIIWGTQDCSEGHYSVTWNVAGEDLTWFTPEHCMVLVGYDDVNVWVADPIYGDIRNYDIQTLKNSYDSLNKQAILIT